MENMSIDTWFRLHI